MMRWMHVKKHHVYVVFRNVAVLRPVKLFLWAFYTDQNVVVFLTKKNGHLRFSANDHVVAIVRRRIEIYNRARIPIRRTDGKHTMSIMYRK